MSYESTGQTCIHNKNAEMDIDNIFGLHKTRQKTFITVILDLHIMLMAPQNIGQLPETKFY